MKSAVQAVVLGGVVVVAMVVGGLLAVGIAGDDEGASSPAGTATNSSTRADRAGSARGSVDTPVNLTAIDDLPTLVERVSPSVVAIITVSGSTTRQATGLGTGVVVDEDGHILTNYHVVEGARQVNVEFTDGTVVPGAVIGSDPGNDLAVVRVNVPDGQLQPATFGDSDRVRPGESVFAIGNPFSEKFSVTSGIISATDRDSTGNTSIGRPVRGMLQTDAAVNPGNSGGPLFNAAGEVIGINTSIENPTGQRVFVGVGFAVSANTAMRFLPDMIDGNPITHPQLGVSGATLNRVNADQLGIDVTKGVYITSVTSGSAADRAGLRAASGSATDSALPPGGDVVTKFDGKDVATIEQLARLVDQYRVGDEVKLTVIRDGSEIELSATLQEWTG
ncbi:MAG: trypsin-like peptidase domain-containing protein [Dehalococcoidia bacterium]